MSKIPQFLRTRIEREIHSAHNPVGMSVHDGRGRFIASDIQHLINIIDEGERLAQGEAGEMRLQVLATKIANDTTEDEYERKIAYKAAYKALTIRYEEIKS